MRRTLSGDEFNHQLRDYSRTAFRLEMQPAYWVAGERAPFAQWLAGDRTPLPELRGLSGGWYEQVRRQVVEGKRMERVRIHDDPPNDYQRWLRWGGQWNIAAGERIDYLTRDEAVKIGLLPDAGPRDWWLFDDSRLMILTHDGQGRRIHTELVTDDDALARARAWWDLAIRHSRSPAL